MTSDVLVHYDEGSQTLSTTLASERGRLARTGTLSFQQVLDDLGFGPQYHMNDVFQNPSHARKWIKYADAGAADWDSLFAEYQSVDDFPAACAWKDLYEQQ